MRTTMDDTNTAAPFTVAGQKMIRDIHGALVGNPAL